jgi:hypothetical protein
MDKTKTMLAAIIGCFIIVGTFVAAYDYKPVKVIDDKALNDCNAIATAKGTANCLDKIDLQVNKAIDDVLFGEKLSEERVKLQEHMQAMYGTNNLKVYEAVNACMETALEAKA